MRLRRKPPATGRDDHFEAASRTVRWVALCLVLISFPLHSTVAPIVLTLAAVAAAYNGLRYIGPLRSRGFFTSRLNALALDHLFVLVLVAVTGGLSSPYYPLFYLLIIATIAAYGIAGFAFALSAQIVLTVLLLQVDLEPLPGTPTQLFTIKIVLLIVFGLIAEQTVRSHDDESLLEGQFSQRIQNERQRLLSLINSLSSGVLALDPDGKVFLYNAAALELLNTNQDITGMNVAQLLTLRDPQKHPVNLMHLVREHSHTLNRQDLEYEASDGTGIILDLTVSPVYAFGYNNGGEGGGGYMAVFRDITKEKSLDQERDEFISVTSHELRTPLAIAEANLSTALLPGYAKIDPKAKGMIEQAHENVIFLSALIEDLATLSRAERGDLKLKAELIDAAQMAEDLVRDYRPQAETKHLKLKLELDPKLGNIVTAKAEFREILQNFLTNALKYTAAGSITLKAAKVEGGTEFAVSDTGIGISASDKTKVFTKFYRSEDYRTRATGGTGLGLYITHKLGEKLGTPISFTSRLNHGSTFKVFVPHHTGKAASHALEAAAAIQNSEDIPPFVGESTKNTVDRSG
jgi:PAS domain S-box-containing protein